MRIDQLLGTGKNKDDGTFFLGEGGLGHGLTHIHYGTNKFAGGGTFAGFPSGKGSALSDTMKIKSAFDTNEKYIEAVNGWIEFVKNSDNHKRFKSETEKWHWLLFFNKVLSELKKPEKPLPPFPGIGKLSSVATSSAAASSGSSAAASSGSSAAASSATPVRIKRETVTRPSAENIREAEDPIEDPITKLQTRQQQRYRERQKVAENTPKAYGNITNEKVDHLFIRIDGTFVNPGIGRHGRVIPGYADFNGYSIIEKTNNLYYILMEICWPNKDLIEEALKLTGRLKKIRKYYMYNHKQYTILVEKVKQLRIALTREGNVDELADLHELKRRASNIRLVNAQLIAFYGDLHQIYIKNKITRDPDTIEKAMQNFFTTANARAEFPSTAYRNNVAALSRLPNWNDLA